MTVVENPEALLITSGVPNVVGTKPVAVKMVSGGNDRFAAFAAGRVYAEAPNHVRFAALAEGRV